MEENTNDITEYGTLIPTTYHSKPHSVLPPSPSTDNIPQPSPIITSFHQYIETLEPWERDLLCYHRQYDIIDTTTTVAIAIATPGELDITSDGGAIQPYRGSYGWTISIQDMILWEGKGYARGYPMDSDRSEPYGQLAAITFLLRYAQYMGFSYSPTKINFYCDNSNVVDQDNSDKDPWYSPKVTMQANWDIYTQLYLTKKEFNRMFPNATKCQHVHGHQDKNKPFHSLHWTAKLNCRCDQLATDILQAYDTKQQEIMYPFPSCPAYLLCNKTYITSKSIKYIEDLTNEQQLHNYHKTRHSWTEQTFRSINWEAFRTARRFKTTSKKFTTKLCCRWLPTLKQLHQHKERDDPTCIRCGKIETQAHVFQCQFRQEWKCKYVTNLRTFLQKYDTDPSLEAAILDGITTWLDNKPNTHKYDPQAAIGWEQFHYGYIAQAWQTQQEEYYKTQSAKTRSKQQHQADHRQANTIFEMAIPQQITAKDSSALQGNANKSDPTTTKKKQKKIVKTGPVWAAKLIECIWLNMRSAWDHRNKAIHEQETTESQERYREELEKKIEFLYSQKKFLSAADRHYYHDKSLAERLLDSNQVLERWYDNNVKVIMYCIKEQQERERRGHKDIRTYFTPAKSKTSIIHAKDTSIPSTSTAPIAITPYPQNTTLSNSTELSRSTDLTTSRQRETDHDSIPHTTNHASIPSSKSINSSHTTHTLFQTTSTDSSEPSSFNSIDLDSLYTPSCASSDTTTSVPQHVPSREANSQLQVMKHACGRKQRNKNYSLRKLTAKIPSDSTPRSSWRTDLLPKTIVVSLLPSQPTSTSQRNKCKQNKKTSCAKRKQPAKHSANNKQTRQPSRKNNKMPTQTNQLMQKKKQASIPEVCHLTPNQNISLKRKRQDSLAALRQHKRQKNDPSQKFSALDLYTPV
jgi:hypothetical protein